MMKKQQQQRRRNGTTTSAKNTRSTTATKMETKTKTTIIKSDPTTLVFFFSLIVLASINFYLLGFSVHTDNINTIRISPSSSSSMSSIVQEKTKTKTPEDSLPSHTAKKKRKKKIIPTKLNYVDGRGMMIQDLFSATWLLNRKRFLELPIEQITSCESGAMVAYWNLYQKQFDGRGTLLPHAKMLLDWTDFNVEHLSKWWGMLQIFNSKSRDEARLFSTVISKLKDYLQHRKPKSSSSPSSLPTTTMENDVPLTKNTIAMVAFMPYETKGKAIRHIDPTGDKGRTLTAYSLAATLKPLFEANIRRVVIVGLKKNDYLHTRDACELLKSIAFNDNNNNNNNNNNSNKEDGDIIFDNQQPTVIINSNNTNAIATIGYTSSSSPSVIIDNNKRPMMEVAHVQLTNKNWYEYMHPGSSRILENVPRGAIIGMQLALSGKMKSKNEQIKWLGERYNNNNNNLVGSESDSNSGLNLEEELSSSSSYWKYVLLTEPDSVLNLNHDLLPLMKNALDDGISLFPHRIHPLPHETDLPTNTTLNRGLYLPNVAPFSNVTTLDPLGDNDEEYIACCDGGNVWPGFKRNPQRKWWENGFRHLSDDGKNNNRNNSSTNINVTAASYNLTKIKKGHRRLLKYKWMRLKDGIGIVFGSNNNGRFCVPSKTMCTNENNNSNNNNDNNNDNPRLRQIMPFV